MFRMYDHGDILPPSDCFVKYNNMSLYFYYSTGPPAPGRVLFLSSSQDLVLVFLPEDVYPHDQGWPSCDLDQDKSHYSAKP